MSEPGPEERPRSAVERAGDLVAELEERIRPAVDRVVGHTVEFFEDVWAEAKHAHRQRRSQDE